jgi:coenzyme Q-binding protein COQ10
MIEHHESRIVPYTADMMYAVVADVERYPDFLPWVLGLRILSRGENRMTAEMMVGYHGLRERYTSDIALDPAARAVDVAQTKGPFRVLENHWRFTPGEKDCRVDFSVRFEFRNRLLAKLAGAKFEKAMLRMTEAFEARAKVLSEQAVHEP